MEDEELMFLQRATVYLSQADNVEGISFVLTSYDSTIWYTNAWENFHLPLHAEY